MTVATTWKNLKDEYLQNDGPGQLWYEEVKKIGAFVIRVDRDIVMPDLNHDAPLEAIHSSEISYKDIPFDMHIKNNGDISEYIREFDKQMSKIFK